MTLLEPPASPKRDVSDVSDVQAPVYAGLGRYVTDTACKNMTYQRKAPIHAGCTPDTGDTSQNNNVQRKSADVKPGGA